MNEILVLAEHRGGTLRDITWELIACGNTLAEQAGCSVSVALLGRDIGQLAEQLASAVGDVVVVDNDRLEHFVSDTYQQALVQLIAQRAPALILMGHTACGLELAPALATSLAIPLVTDCVGLTFEGDALTATRQLYGGKVSADVLCKPSDRYLATIRGGAFPADESPAAAGTISTAEVTIEEDDGLKRFIEYLECEAGEVDITQSDVIVAVGRGIKEQKDMAIVEEFASSIGGVLACSRPIIDKKWLPKDRQVGSSGKSVRPKLYIALGISGSFQHLAGIKSGGTIVAINKDPNAPFFTVADYGIVADLFKVLPVLKTKIEELRQGS